MRVASTIPPSRLAPAFDLERTTRPPALLFFFANSYEDGRAAGIVHAPTRVAFHSHSPIAARPATALPCYRRVSSPLQHTQALNGDRLGRQCAGSRKCVSGTRRPSTAPEHLPGRPDIVAEWIQDRREFERFCSAGRAEAVVHPQQPPACLAICGNARYRDLGERIDGSRETAAWCCAQRPAQAATLLPRRRWLSTPNFP